MNKETYPKGLRGILMFIRCQIFHGKYRKRTGERIIRSISIDYEIYCEKCKVYDRTISWFYE